MMLFKRKAAAYFAICITAILVIALCGCEDLGEFEDPEEYYNSFGDVVFMGGIAETGKPYSIEEYFYNEESRDDFLMNDDGVYVGVEHSDYVYVAIPFTRDIEMDSLALYLQAKSSVTLYINVYITDKLPKNWKEIEESETLDDESTKAADESLEDKLEETSTDVPQGGSDGDTQKYDDPNPKSKIGEITLHLSEGKWASFVLDYFNVDGNVKKSIYVEGESYILLQIRNNSGACVYKKGDLYVDGQSGQVCEKAEITMTNLLVRALVPENKTEANGGEN